MANKSSATRTSLQTALDGQVKTISQAKVSKLAGVATRTVSMVVKGTFATTPPPQEATVKQLRGYIGTLARLARYVEIDIQETLREYGIDLTLPNLQRIIEESLGKVAPEADGQTAIYADIDLLPIMQGVSQSGYLGKVLRGDLQILLSLQEQAGKTLTPSVIREVLLLQHPGSSVL